jgi:hypothetical protein
MVDARPPAHRKQPERCRITIHHEQQGDIFMFVPPRAADFRDDAAGAATTAVLGDEGSPARRRQLHRFIRDPAIFCIGS